MTNFLMGKGVWDIVTGNDEEPHFPVQNTTVAQIKAYKEWHEKTRRVLHWLSVCVSDAMIGHIQECTNAKDAWDTLVKLYGTTTLARKMQLKQELSNVKKGNLSINDYVLKVRNIVEKLGSIGVAVEDEDMVLVVLNGLGKDYTSFQTSIGVRETFPSFNDLVAMLISEELRIGADSSSSKNEEQAFYSNRSRGRGRGRYGRGRGRNNNDACARNANNDARPARGRGRGSASSNDSGDCFYCGKSGHYAKDCYKKQADIRSGKLQHGNYASSSHDDSEKLFAMQQKMHSATMQDHMRDDVWYVDSGASNHMTSRGNWFKELDAMRTPGYVETGDDTVHPIEHMGRVPVTQVTQPTHYL